MRFWDMRLNLNIVDFGEIDADLVDLQCFPEMVYGYYLACHPEPLLLELAIIDDGYLLTPVQFRKCVLYLLIHRLPQHQSQL